LFYLPFCKCFENIIIFELAFPAFVVKVCLAHMACQVGSGNEGLDEVTFLYRLSAGACPKSYGVNVARLAGMLPCFELL